MGETRLICPGCGAEYRLDSAMIPPGGRQVECSACARVWFHPGAGQMPERDRIAQAVHVQRERHPSDAPRLNHPLPQDVLDILTAEADRDQAHRAEDFSAAEMRRILPTEPPAAPARHINPAPQAASETIAPDLLEATVTRTTPSRPPQPTPDRINPGFSATAATAVPAVTLPADQRPGKRGLTLGLVLAAAALALYLVAPQMADAGRVGAWLAETRLAVDDARLWLFNQASGIIDPLIAALR